MMCIHCQSLNVIKFGFKKRKQRFFCKDCKKLFLDFYNFDRKHYQAEIIAKVWELYYDGMSYYKIKFYLGSHYNLKRISTSTIFNWVQTYSQLMRRYTDSFMPKNIGIIHVDETTVILKRELLANWLNKSWLWVGMDATSRIAYGIHISLERDSINAKEFMKRINANPKIVISDQLHCYKKAIQTRWDGKAKHLQYGGLTKDITNNCLERLNGTIKDRLKPMRGFCYKHTAKNFFDGFIVYNNVIKPHFSLDKKTPFEARGINLNLGDNPILELLKRSVSKCPIPKC